MPNHFTLCCIAGRNWTKLEEAGLDDFPQEMFDELPKTNLCEVSAKLPDELQGIVSSTVPCRYIHKETGERWLKDCDGPWGADDRDKWEQVELTDAEQAELINKYGACTWYEWQRDNWGTKWGTYGLKVSELGGDGSPIFIECQCAWGPPNPKSMRAITEYLEEKYYLKNIKWFGHDPYDNDTCDIEVAESVFN